MPDEQLTPTLITRIVELGRRPDLDSPGVLQDFSDLRDHDWINRLHWKTWDVALANLATDDIVALAKALSTMEEGWHWDGGSVAAVIWVHRNLQQRDSRRAKYVARWITKRNS